jgi:Lrp/AsnC family transcriptional regulator for asnA, asnC and gidA
MKLDAIDEAIIAAFQEDGRQSNREIARRLNISEGTVRQRLKKLTDAGAVQFDVVVDLVQMGIGFVAFVRAAVSPQHLESFLNACAKLPDVFYLAAVAGRFNVLALICTATAEDGLRLINAHVEKLSGLSDIEIRQVIGFKKHDFRETVIPRK